MQSSTSALVAGLKTSQYQLNQGLPCTHTCLIPEVLIQQVSARKAVCSTVTRMAASPFFASMY